MECAHVSRFIDAYVDGEFDAHDRAEMERHLETCEACRAEVRRQVAWKSAVRARMPRPSAPYGLHRRLLRALDGETRNSLLWRRASWRLAPALAAAAVLALLIVRRQPGPSPFVRESILDHERNWPVEVTGPDPDGVAIWFRGKVDFPVRPPRLGQDAHLLGGRLWHVGQRHAAYLVYAVGGGHKVSVVVFDAGDVPIEAPRRVIVHDRPVYMGGEQGYHVAEFRDQGLGYTMTTDLDEPAMMRLLQQTSFEP
ncbi:MAG TPA: zf-HC2 domain-containing protein [Polyangia bacterium]|nr:zf-HC2 domain-containing protein [Polyangia bacterium]